MMSLSIFFMLLCFFVKFSYLPTFYANSNTSSEGMTIVNDKVLKEIPEIENAHFLVLFNIWRLGRVSKQH